MILELKTTSAIQTQQLAAELALLFRVGDVVVMTGDLGAGKTCFVKSAARVLGVKDTVTSPTFVIMKVYRGRVTLYHIDLYRLDSIAQMTDLGLMDVLPGDGVTILEWGDKARSLLPDNHLVIDLRCGAALDEREVFLEANAQDWIERLAKWAKITRLAVSQRL